MIAKAGLDRTGINDSIDAYVKRAQALGAPIELQVHEEGRHGFDVLDEGNRSRLIIRRAEDYLRAHLDR